MLESGQSIFLRAHWIDSVALIQTTTAPSLRPRSHTICRCYSWPAGLNRWDLDNNVFVADTKSSRPHKAEDRIPRHLKHTCGMPQHPRLPSKRLRVCAVTLLLAGSVAG
jgi:hypothetical protein